MEAELASAQRKLAALRLDEREPRDHCSVSSASTSRSSSSASVPSVPEIRVIRGGPDRKERQQSQQPEHLQHANRLDHHDVSLMWQRDEDESGSFRCIEGSRGPRRIYVGTEKMSRFRKGLDKFGIRTIVNCTRGAPNKFAEDPDFQYMQVELSDDTCETLLGKLDAVTSFIQHEAEDEIILIHCSKGVSRSISVFLAWLIRYRRLPLREGLELAKSRRSVAAPNMGFIRQLLVYETDVLAQASLTMDDFLPCPVCLHVNFDSKKFACGHRCCGSCLRKFAPGAECAHCAYKTASRADATPEEGIRKRSSSIEDLSSWRTACPPPPRSPSPPPLAD
ncbi:Dual specificity protein phosphatase, putative [Hondaea fermentalgiana]|uniref:protein-tyrosine-phosphatase n=1 Tax=Hondaea fermentalgiana TaxID=2315210 RepID=A0A2R5G870_9STRA|nr:Dual specificity protein phosphatase, putative [Hondaea fermentalgiana]|eukprot:GBG24683.1 Dual specificity protein phosphatase, putative [Hondaea fermentalgiana]